MVGGAIGDAVDSALKHIISRFEERLSNFLESELLEPLLKYILGTPHPDNIYTFEPPTNGTWATVYSEVYSDIQLLVPMLFVLALGLTFFFNIFEDPKKRKVTIQRLVLVFPFAISWWWFGAWFLRVTHELTMFVAYGGIESITDDLSAMFSATIGSVFVGIFIYVIGATILLVILAIYFARWVGIYAYMVGMPILLLLWCMPIGPVQGWAKSMMSKFVPLVLIPIPVALMFRISLELTASAEDVMSIVMGTVTLVVAGVLPKFMFTASYRVSRTMRRSSRLGRATAAGAGIGAAGGAAAGVAAASAASSSARSSRTQGRSTKQQTLPGTNVPPEQGPNDPYAHTADLNFSSGAEKRAAKLGAGSRKATEKTIETTKGLGKKGKEFGKRTADSAAKNYYSDKNTAWGMASDAKEGAKKKTKEGAKKGVQKPIGKAKGTYRSLSQREKKVEQRLKSARDNYREKYAGPNGSAVAGTENSDTSESSSLEASSSVFDSSLGSSESIDTNRETYDRNQTERNIGSFGSSKRND